LFSPGRPGAGRRLDDGRAPPTPAGRLGWGWASRLAWRGGLGGWVGRSPCCGHRAQVDTNGGGRDVIRPTAAARHGQATRLDGSPADKSAWRPDLDQRPCGSVGHDQGGWQISGPEPGAGGVGSRFRRVQAGFRDAAAARWRVVRRWRAANGPFPQLPAPGCGPTRCHRPRTLLTGTGRPQGGDGGGPRLSGPRLKGRCSEAPRFGRHTKQIDDRSGAAGGRRPPVHVGGHLRRLAKQDVTAQRGFGEPGLQLKGQQTPTASTRALFAVAAVLGLAWASYTLFLIQPGTTAFKGPARLHGNRPGGSAAPGTTTTVGPRRTPGPKAGCTLGISLPGGPLSST